MSEVDYTLRHVLFCAGSQWDKAPTPEELVSALGAADYVIVPRDPTPVEAKSEVVE